MTRVSLQDVHMAPAQVWNNIRLVPLLRRRACKGIRLGIDGGLQTLQNTETERTMYVPHGMIGYTEEQSAHFGTQLLWERDFRNQRHTHTQTSLTQWFSHFSSSQEERREARFVPRHLLWEGMLLRLFGAPSKAWQSYSDALAHRRIRPSWFAPTPETSRRVLAEALQTFEIHKGQSGALLYVGSELASAFLVPSAQDYRALHRTVLEDLFGPLIWHSRVCQEAPAFTVRWDEKSVASFGDLRRQLKQTRLYWSDFHRDLGSSLFRRQFRILQKRGKGDFQLRQFISDLESATEQHMGEKIVSKDGQLAYLKTIRLTRTQVRRARLVQALSRGDWKVTNTASLLGLQPLSLRQKLQNTHLHYLVGPMPVEKVPVSSGKGHKKRKNRKKNRRRS